MTLHFTDLSRILFIDIETVPERADFDEITTKKQDLWAKKAKYAKFISPTDTADTKLIADSFAQKAGIYAEFAKIVCISAGYLVQEGASISHLKIKSYYGHSEVDILQAFSAVLAKHYNRPDRHSLCGHNIKEFDVPFICRRLLINRLALPKIIDVGGAKSWQTKQFIDTLQLWKFGDYKNYTSLDLIASALGLPSPKEEMNGSEVRDTYYEHNDLDKIARYCEQDVFTTVRVYLALMGLEDLTEEQVVSKTF